MTNESGMEQILHQPPAHPVSQVGYHADGQGGGREEGGGKRVLIYGIVFK